MVQDVMTKMDKASKNKYVKTRTNVKVPEGKVHEGHKC